MNEVTWAQTQVSAGDAAWPGGWEAPPQTSLEANPWPTLGLSLPLRHREGSFQVLPTHKYPQGTPVWDPPWGVRNP